jgi:hypothetical protein
VKTYHGFRVQRKTSNFFHCFTGDFRGSERDECLAPHSQVVVCDDIHNFAIRLEQPAQRRFEHCDTVSVDVVTQRKVKGAMTIDFNVLVQILNV